MFDRWLPLESWMATPLQTIVMLATIILLIIIFCYLFASLLNAKEEIQMIKGRLKELKQNDKHIPAKEKRCL